MDSRAEGEREWERSGWEAWPMDESGMEELIRNISHNFASCDHDSRRVAPRSSGLATSPHRFQFAVSLHDLSTCLQLVLSPREIFMHSTLTATILPMSVRVVVLSRYGDFRRP